MMQKELTSYKQEVEVLKIEKSQFQLKIEDATKAMKEELDQANEQIIQLSGDAKMVEMYKEKVDKFTEQQKTMKQIEMERDELKQKLQIL